MTAERDVLHAPQTLITALISSAAVHIVHCSIMRFNRMKTSATLGKRATHTHPNRLQP